MSTLTKEERELIFGDLIDCYRFCKKDKRNHIFNAINAIKKYRKKGIFSRDLKEAERCFQSAKVSYSHYVRMMSVAMFLKLNLNDFITLEEKRQAVVDLILHYDWRMKSCSYHIQSTERSLNNLTRSGNDIDPLKNKELEKRFLSEIDEYDSYSKKINLAKSLKDEIKNLTQEKAKL